MTNPRPGATAPDPNPVLAALLSRRSTRSGFNGHPVPAAMLQQIAGAGLAAPSSKNARPWRLHIVTDRDTLTLLATAVATAEGAESYVPHDPEMGGPRLEYVSTVVESAEVLRQVAAAIFIENRGLFSNGRRRLAASGLAALASSLVGYGLEMIGIGAAIENMWIAAQSLGIQAAFMGDVAVAEDEIARVLGIQGDLAGVLALGFSEEPVPSPRPARDAADAVHVVWHRGG